MTFVCAHRGGAALAPENTMGAFRAAHARFPDAWLEMDIQLTADGVPVVIHDATLDRTTDCRGVVAELKADDVCAANAATIFAGWDEHEPVPRFEDVLREGAEEGWRLLVEVKCTPGEPNFDPTGAGVPDVVVPLVRAAGFPLDRIVFMSFWPPVLDRIKEQEPSVKAYLLSTWRLPSGAAGFLTTDAASFARDRDYDGIGPSLLTPDLGGSTVGDVHEMGLDVVVWTINAPDDIERAVTWGLDGIISDHPDRVEAALTYTARDPRSAG